MGEAKTGQISLKLLIDRNENKVIFGEAGKDFVDFLFHFLSLPVGTVVKLLSRDKMVGSLGKIYGSIESLNASYMEPHVYKDDVLNPRVYSSHGDATPLLGHQSDGDQDNGTKYLKSNVKWCNCGRPMKYVKKTYPSPEKKKGVESGKGGYVKELVNYMIMDDLVVKPMSTIASITLLSEVKDMSAVETLEVFIGKNEALDLLKASFETDKVLTSLFLGKQSSYEASSRKKRSKKAL